MKKDNKKKSFPAIPMIIFAAVLVSFLSENVPEIGRVMNSKNSANGIFIAVTAVVVIAVIIAVISAVIKKKRTATPAEIRAKEHELKTHAHAESSSVRCTCARGRQRYLDQVDMFLKNGLIDKKEWKTMRERYEKMSIPEDME